MSGERMIDVTARSLAESEREQERMALRDIEVQRVAQVSAMTISPTEMEQAMVGPFLSPVDFTRLAKAFRQDDRLAVFDLINKAVKAWALDQAEVSVGDDRTVDNYGGTD